MGEPQRGSDTARRDLEARTAKLFGEIHALIPSDTVALHRGLLSPDHLEVPENFFAGIRCLDVGFGGTGHTLFSMVSQGAQRAFGVDLSLENARNALTQDGAVRDRISLAVASLLALPFRDSSFDFVHCNGVLPCLRDPRPGFSELVRVLRAGGTLYVGVYGQGGFITWLSLAGRGAARVIPQGWIKRLLERGLRLDAFLVSQVLDILYAPAQGRFTEPEVRRWFREAGFAAPRRLRNPTWLYRNFLERLLHASAWQPDSGLGRLLHGEGWIIMAARRPAPKGP